MSKADALAWIDSRRDDLVEQLMNLSAINSGSTNLAGLKKMRMAFETLFMPLADDIQVLDSTTATRTNLQGDSVVEEYGQILSVSKRPDAPFQVLLVGHMDTVFPEDHAFQAPRFIDDNTLNGPGVADMKGGILVMLTALQAFERTWPDSSLGWRVLLNSDEETGSLGSVDTLVEAASRAHAGLVYEPALADGTLAGARKGSGNFSLIANGLSAHAGREFDKGRNAIVALAGVIPRLAGLTDLDQGITVNVGKISGGSALNVVPARAVCQFNIRCPQQQQQTELASRLDALLAEFNAGSDFSFELTGGFTRPPKHLSPANKLLMNFARDCGQQLQIDLNFRDTGGCCDGNNLAAAGLPNIDTLGVCGAHIHTDQEYMLLDSLSQRSKLSFLLLEKLAAQGEQLLETR